MQKGTPCPRLKKTDKKTAQKSACAAKKARRLGWASRYVVCKQPKKKMQEVFGPGSGLQGPVPRTNGPFAVPYRVAGTPWRMPPLLMIGCAVRLKRRGRIHFVTRSHQFYYYTATTADCQIKPVEGCRPGLQAAGQMQYNSYTMAAPGFAPAGPAAPLKSRPKGRIPALGAIYP